MRHGYLGCLALALVGFGATVSYATDGSIGIYADPAGTIAHGSFSLGQPTTLYVIAHLEGATVSGISGAEFRIDGFPADWFASLSPNPAATVVLGDPLRTNGGVHRVNMAFAFCAPPNGQGNLLLYTMFVLPYSPPTSSALQVAAGDPPSNQTFLSPTFLQCDFPNFTPVAATGAAFTIDNVRAPQGLDYSFAPGYAGVRGVQPIAGLPGDTFRFRAAYSQSAGQPLPAGQPVLQLDGNGDGDSNDPGEGTYALVPADHDSTTIDGKEYRVDVALAAAPSGRWRYRFAATDSHGQPATGAATVWNDSLFVSPGLPDLVVRPEDVSVAGGANLADPVSITVHFTNASDVAVHDVGVRVEENGTLFVERTIPHLAPRATGMLVFDWVFPQSGLHVLTVRVDPANGIAERDESNNVVTHSVMVSLGTPGSITLDLFPVSFQDAPLQRFRVAGSAHYALVAVGSAPPVVGGRVTWAPSWDPADETRTDSTGAFSREFTAPPAPGLYSVGVTVTDGTRSSSANVPLQVTGASGTVHGPDLVAMELTPAPFGACPGTALSARWSVRNIGDQTADATTVQLEMDGTHVVAQRPVGPIPPGAWTALPDADLGVATAGSHWVTMRVDPSNTIAELREDNDALTVPLFVPGSGPDLGVDGVQFQVPPCTGTPIGMQITVANRGCAASTATQVALRQDGVESARWALGPVAAGASQVVGVQQALANPGCHLLEFVVDPDSVPGADADAARDALPIAACLRVCSLPPDANLNYRITGCDLTATNPHARVGEAIQFKAAVTNTGFTNAIAPVVVRFYLGSVQWGPDVSIGPLASGQTLTATSAPWTVGAAHAELRVVVDPGHQQPETNELDNEAVEGLPYDLYLYPLSACPPSNPAMFSACSPCPDAPVAIHALLFNDGLLAADSVAVQFADLGAANPILGTVVATGSNLVPGCNGHVIPPGATLIELVHAFPDAGTHHIQVVADPARQWPDFDMTSNSLTANLSVLCNDQPDLTAEVAWPPTLVVAVGDTIHSTPLRVRNLGPGGAVNVHLRLKLDGAPLCGDLVVGSVPGFSTLNVACSVPWVMTASGCATRLEVCADPQNLVPETDETNNCSQAAAPNGTSDFRPYSLSISPPQPLSGTPVIVNVRVFDQVGLGAVATVSLFTYPSMTPLGAATVTASPFGFASFPWTYDPSLPFFLVMVSNACPRDVEPFNDSQIYSLTGSPPGTPVEVTDLEATSIAEGVQLRWRAGLDLQRFYVERRAASDGDWDRLAVDPQRGTASAGAIEWRFLDATATPGARYEYRVMAAAADGAFDVAGSVQVEHNRARTTPWLESLRPHPFRPGGVVALYLPRPANAVLSIFDAAGRRVAVPWNGALGVGRHEIHWDAIGDNGRRLPAGVYFVELRAEGSHDVRRLVLVH